jgi:hypothetical protein
MTVNQTIKHLQDIVKLNPSFGNLPTIYSEDDEGNGYGNVISQPLLCQVHDINDHNLKLVGFYIENDTNNDSILINDVNAVMIN